jgi:GH15 family glucan-1,4-alpha-glucosidase
MVFAFPVTNKIVSYQPIENYGIIGDLNTIALVGLNGSIDFMCFPRFDSPSVFAALLDDKKGGFFSISPEFKEMKSKQLYLPDTNVLLTRFLSPEGVGEVTDFMPVDPGGEKRLIRRVTTIRGEVTYQLRCCPRFNYGKDVIKLSRLMTGRSFFMPMAPMGCR